VTATWKRLPTWLDDGVYEERVAFVMFEQLPAESVEQSFHR
jgi:hypothetical protein